jgi:hypothetical protein
MRRHHAFSWAFAAAKGSTFTASAAALSLCALSTHVRAQSRHIYGIHDFEPGPDELTSVLEQEGVRGAITATEAVGSNPADASGKDYTRLANRGHLVIARLNNGYGAAGTIPPRSRWNDFAARCANFAAASRGCTLWVIGNETNLWGEWPEEDGFRRYVSPEDYADCFRRVYNAIKARRPSHQVLPQALAPFAGPYGASATHDAMPIDHVTYMRRMLDAIRASGGIDGIAIHINSRGYSRSDVFSTQQVNGNYWSFFCYKDWLQRGVPPQLRDLPVYATESNGYYFWKGGHPEAPARTYEPGWVQAVLVEVDRWNHNEAVLQGLPEIRSLNFYRWCAFCDGWNIDGAPVEGQILADLAQAASFDLEWDERPEAPEGSFTLAIGRRPPPQEKEDLPYRGVWRSYPFRVGGASAVPVTFELTGAARAEGDDEDARLLVDADDPADDASWNTAAALDGSRDQGATATARFARTLAPGLHSLRIQVDNRPFIERVVVTVPQPAPRFRRGDANSDALVDLSDAVAVLFHLFGGGAGIGCLDAADADDRGSVELTDAVLVLQFLFRRGPSPAPPLGCGEDTTADALAPCADAGC